MTCARAFFLFAAPAALLLQPGTARAVEKITVHAENQAEYSLNTQGENDRDQPKEIFEDWLDVDLRFDDLLLGFRYEAFQPHELRGDSLREGIVQRYAAFDFRNAAIRVGNFYEIFGRGMLFRSYEERDIRIDNNVDGALFTGEAGDFRGKVFSGRMRNTGPTRTSEREDALRGADLEYRVPSIGNANVSVGGSYVLQSLSTEFGERFRLEEEGYAGRGALTHPLFDLYGEYARINRLDREDVMELLGTMPSKGVGHYIALSMFPVDFLSFSAEYKRYEEFRFTSISDPGTDINNPPSLTRENSYALVSRNPHQIDPDDEKGFQVEAVVTPRYGTTLTLNRSETVKVDEDLWRHDAAFNEWYGELRHEVNDEITVAAVYDFQRDEKRGIETHTPVLDIEYFPMDKGWALRGEYQFQERDVFVSARDRIERSHFALVEWSVNNDLIVSMTAEHATSVDPSRPEKDDFLMAQVDYRVNQNHSVAIAGGKRQAGFVCVGGVCRFEPAFEGVEVKLRSSF